MKIDYSKTSFTYDECKYMLNECKLLHTKNPNHIPILVQLKSNVLKIDKQKFLVANDISFNDFINNTLKKRLINLANNDKLIISNVHFGDNDTEIFDKPKTNVIIPNSKTMNDIYSEFKDPFTNFLFFKISRETTYKSLKGYVKYLSGY